MVSKEEGRTTLFFASIWGIVGIWMFGTALEVISAILTKNLRLTYLFHIISNIGVFFFPLGLLFFAFSFGDEEKFFTRRYLPILFLVPPTSLFLTLITNEWHQLHYTAVYLEKSVLGVSLMYNRGILSLGNVMVTFAYFTMALYYFTDLYITLRTEKKEIFAKQVQLIILWILMMVGGLAIPVVGDLAGENGSILSSHLIRPVIIFGGLLVVIHALRSTKLLEVIPIGRDHTIFQLKEGFLVVNNHMELVDLNQQAKVYLFAECDNPIGQNLLVMLYGQSYQKPWAQQIPYLAAAIQEILDGKSAMKVVELTTQKDGKAQQVLGVTLSSIRSSRRIHAVGILQDITKQKQMEALKVSEQKFRSLVEHSLDGIALIAPDGVINFCNIAFAKMYGRKDRSEVEGRLIYEFVPEKYREAEKVWIQSAFQEGVKPKLRLTIGLKSNGVHFDLEQSYHVVHEPMTGMKLLQVMGRDVSARMELDRLRSEFITMVSHELRTPLTAVRGFVDILKGYSEKSSAEEKEIYFEILDRNIKRLERLIQGVSMLGQIEHESLRMKREEFNLEEFLNDSIGPYRTLLADQLEEQWVDKGKSLVIEGDPGRLLQVIDNLMDNAINNTPEDRRQIKVKMEVLPKVVHIIISDNGAGIAEEDLDRIFEKFTSIPTQYHTQGTGIGLYISQVIVEAHGGNLTIESEGKDQGTTCIVELPRFS